jgi:spermidine synthase
MTIGSLAPWYRWIEYAAFGRSLERRRFAFLPRLASASRILMLGEGDGRALAQSLRVAPLAHFDVVEVSPEMIALARRRAGDSDRVVFLCRDALKAEWPIGHYDAIVTNFFLDCFTVDEVRPMIRRLASSLKANGIWLINEFAIPDSGWRRLHAQLWIRAMYLFFRLSTRLLASELPPISRLTREAGMRCVGREQSRAGLIVSEVWMRAPDPGAPPS